MPKGIYPRGNKTVTPTVQSISKPSQGGELRTVTVSELPTRQSANANVESMRQTHGDDGVSTTERLFGDIALRDELDKTDPNRGEEILQRPISEEEIPEPTPEPKKDLEAQQPTAQEPQVPKPTESNPTQDDFLDWEKLSGKKIRQKIDGKEVIVTAEDLKKYSDQDQIKKHLAEAADKVGDERRKLAEERRQLQELRQQKPQQYEAPIQNGQPQGIQQPQDLSNLVLQRIQFLEAQLQQLAQGTQPVIYQSNRQRVSDELKSQGFNDFLDYIPKMEAQMTSIQDPQLMAFYDTPQGAKALYFQLKAQDMQKAPVKNVPQGTITQSNDNQAVRNPVPPQVQVDGGSQASGGHIDNAPHLYRQAFRRATSLGDDKEAWNEVLRQKGILPD